MGYGKSAKRSWLVRNDSIETTIDWLLKHQKEEDIVICDIRHKEDFDKGHIPQAQHINEQVDVTLFSNKRVIICCYRGISSLSWAEYLKDKGILAWSLEGGMEAWTDQKLPIESS